MTRLALVLTLVLLVLPATAAGKGISRVELCGADGCTDVTREASHRVMSGGVGAAPPRAPEPSFRLRVTISHGEDMLDVVETTWLPRSGLMRGEDGVWMEATENTQTELLSLAQGLEPKPAPGERRSAAREEDGDGGGPSALAVGAPAAGLLGLAAVMTQRRRRRRG